MGSSRRLSGSEVLGAELRRLRGTRPLALIAKLTREPPIAPHAAPLSTAGISQIENGVTMPSVETLQTLAEVYRVSPQWLLDRITEERLAAAIDLPESLEQTREERHRAFAGGAWRRGLALCQHGERLAEDPVDVLKWRGNRASCLRMLGKLKDAAWLYLDILDSPDLEQSLRHVIRLNAADTFASLGYFGEARTHSQLALAEAPDAVEPERRAQLLRSAARVLISGFDEGAWQDVASVREAMRHLEEARSLVDDNSPWAHVIDVQVATNHGRLGNRRLQDRGLRDALKRARAARNERAEMWALLNLGALEAERERPLEACKLLAGARDLAESLDEYVAMFEASFRLWKAARGHDELAVARDHAWRKCLRLYPQLAQAGAALREFEQVMRGQESKR